MHEVLWGTALALGVVGLALLIERAAPRSWRRRPASKLALALVLAVLFTGIAVIAGVAGAALAALASIAVAAPVLLHRARRAHRIEQAIARLGDPVAQAESIARLGAMLGTAPSWPTPGAYLRWAQVVIYVAASASRAGVVEIALEWLGRLDVARLDDERRAARAQAAAACSIQTRDRARAREEIARVARPAPNAVFERAITALEMLLDALDGVSPERVEKRARETAAEEPEGSVRATLLMARAHALADLARREDALEVLRDLRTVETSMPLLERVVRHGGPASTLAEALLAEAGGPYR
jgi:hypothetical protein